MWSVIKINMYTLPTTFLLLFCGVHAALDYPETKTEGMIGFAKVGGTTGGWIDGSVVRINSLADLQNNIGGNTAKVLIINANISAATKTTLTLGSNKSLIGSYSKPTLHNIYFQDTNSSGNVIFQNLIFQHDASIKNNDDIQLLINHSTRYWIDHCSFVGHKYSPNDGSLDKLVYFGESADYITISYSYFGNHAYGIILGYPDDKAPANYNTRMTIFNNHYENIHNRSPGMMRWGWYHLFNNYICDYNRAITIHANAKVFSENNYFEKGTNEILDDFGNGEFCDHGSIPAVKGQKSPKCSWNPKQYYSYKLKESAQAKSDCLSEVGAQSTGLIF